MARSRSFCHPKHPEACWIKYKLNVNNIKRAAVAKKSQCSAPFVSMVIYRKRHSKIVEAALAELLGYQSWEQLWADASNNAVRRAI